MKKWESIIKDKLERTETAPPESLFDEFISRLDAKEGHATSVPAGNTSTTRRRLLLTLAPAAAAGLAAVLLLCQPGTPKDGIQAVKQTVAPVAVAPEPDESAGPVKHAGPPTLDVAAKPVPTSATPIVQKHPVSSARGADNVIKAGTIEEINDADETDVLQVYEHAEASEAENQSAKSYSGPIMPVTSPYKSEGSTAKTFTMKVAPASGIVAGGGLLAAVVTSLSGHDYPSDNIPEEGRYFGFGDFLGPFSDRPTGEITHHKALFKGGLSIGIPLADRLKIVTGVEYSQYNSDFEWWFYGGPAAKSTVGEKKQIVRYLGVPLRLDYSLARNYLFDVYIGAGVQADYCIGADLVDSRTNKAQAIEALKRDGFVFSLLAAGGIQINANKRMGLYLEPELVWTGGKPTEAEKNYYPWIVDGLLPPYQDNDRLQTYRTEHPFIFTVATGLRINLGK